MALFGKKKAKEEKKEAKAFELPSPPSEIQKIKEDIGELPELPEFKPVSFPSFTSVKQPEPLSEEKEEKTWPLEKEEKEKPRTQEVGEDFRVPLTASITSVAKMPEADSIAVPKFDKPIFVKIDKFKDALSNFELVKRKMHEIDSLLKRIKETRSKEQEELASWESEIEEIKTRIESIDSKLFSKLD